MSAVTSLTLGTLRLPAASFGAANPLPPLTRTSDVHEQRPIEVDDDEMRAGIAYGHLPTLLPYLVQDGYDRVREERDVEVAVLENDVLRATFLPGLGGRLWSLVHLPTGRELLHRNPILQPANLALRNAWFAGGVEWNLGTTGHTTLTCEPLHTVRVAGADGSPVLRMYEYERTRELVYSLDVSLPPGSPVLLVAVRILNPTTRTVPVYWWSNAAVPETDGLRVVVPAESAYHYAYDSGLQVVPVPEDGGQDISFPASAPSPADWFFDCRAADRPWISAVDADGRGLLQVSTKRLVGRKLFVWGRSVGGRRWQEFLSGEDRPYVEIQAGLARTQLEHLPLPAGESWSWVEAYGMAEVDPAEARGPWASAQDAVRRVADALAPAAVLERELDQAAARADQPAEEVLRPGSGWGALEQHRRRAAGEPLLPAAGTPWTDDTLGTEQEPWLALVSTGELPDADPARPPRSYVVGPAWAPLLESAPEHWATWLHRGVARWHAGAHEDARAATEASLAQELTPWALRNLAAMEHQAGDVRAAADHYRRAHALAPVERALTVEAMQALVDADRPDEALALLEGVPTPVRAHGRVRLLELRAALRAGDLDRAGTILDSDLVVDDLREGEDSLADLWEDFHRARGTTPVPPLPSRLDFRMHVAAAASGD
jgi:tetratricopeptide (TPR) repeat protein